jgi:hypothetical protein
MAIIKDLYVKLVPGTKVRLRKYKQDSVPNRWTLTMLKECSGKIVTITRCGDKSVSDFLYSCNGLDFEVEEYPWVFRYADIEEIITEEEKKEPTTQELYDTFIKLVDETLTALKTNNPPKKEVKEVKRQAKVGEYIKIINPIYACGCYNKDDILKVYKVRDGMAYVDTGKEYFFSPLFDQDTNPRLTCDEYVVLENYEPETEKK